MSASAGSHGTTSKATPVEVAALLDASGFDTTAMHAIRVFVDHVPSSLVDLEPGSHGETWAIGAIHPRKSQLARRMPGGGHGERIVAANFGLVLKAGRLTAAVPFDAKALAAYRLTDAAFARFGHGLMHQSFDTRPGNVGRLFSDPGHWE